MYSYVPPAALCAQTGGHPLLAEMSQVELRERLACLKEAKCHEQQQRRERIMREKQDKEELLLGKLDAINHYRKAVAQDATLRSVRKYKSDTEWRHSSGSLRVTLGGNQLSHNENNNK